MYSFGENPPNVGELYIVKCLVRENMIEQSKTPAYGFA